MSNWSNRKSDTGDDLPPIETLRRALYVSDTGELRWNLDPQREDFSHGAAWAAARRRAGDIAERGQINGRSTVTLFGREFDADRVKRALRRGTTDLSKVTLPQIAAGQAKEA